MSIGKRILDLARANLNALLDKASGETSIDELTDDELEAELQRRRERRQREEDERKAAQRAADHARARAASAPARPEPPPGTVPPTANRPPMGNRPPSAGNAQSRAGSASSPRNDPRRDARREQRKGPPAGVSLPERRLRELYAQLEVPFGAPFDEVKKSFRRLMRKYHPDLHAGNPQKLATATQLTMSLTQAYNELEQHLLGGPNRT